MGPKDKHTPTGDFYQQPLVELINHKHPLVKLAEFFPSRTRRPTTSPRLIAGLMYLQHTFGCSDEELIWTWVENPYWQHFCVEIYFQHQAPIDPSSMTRWRQRIGEKGVERLLKETIEVAHRGNVVKVKSFEEVIVDTTVMEKTVAYPADSIW